MHFYGNIKKRSIRTQKTMQRVELPEEIWIAILEYLCLTKRCGVATVCKGWGDVGGFIDRSVTVLSYSDISRMQGDHYFYREPRSFSHLSNLVSFDGQIEDLEHLEEIKRHARSLRKLRIRSNGFENVEPYCLDGLSNLTTLAIHKKCNISEPVLLSMPYLTSLDMGSESLSDALLQTLATQLKSLTLRSLDQITDVSLVGMTRLSSLRLLNCGNITEASVSVLKQLEHFSLTYWYSLSDNTGFVKGTVFAGLTNLSSLSLKGHDTIKDEDISHLSSLRSLILDGNDLLNKSVIGCFSQLTRLVMYDEFDENSEHALLCLTNLKTLKLRDYAGNISSRSLCLMTQLTSLSLTNSECANTQYLSGLVNLRVLKLDPSTACLCYNPLLPASLEVLKNEYDLNIYQTTDILTQISARLSNLRILRLDESPMSTPHRDRSVYRDYEKAWARCTSLRSLSTVYCKADAASLIQFLLPNVDIIHTAYDC